MAEELMNEEVKTQSMPLIALRGISVFPRTEVRFDIERDKSVQALEAAMNGDSLVFLANQKDPSVDLPTAKDLYTVGTVARIKRILRLPGEQLRVLVSGQYRARMKKMVREAPYFVCELQKIEEADDVALTPDVLALIRTASDLYTQYRSDHQRFPNDDFKGFADLNQFGYFDSAEDCVTKTPGLFVAGDCRSKFIRQVTTACGDGAVAALAACRYVDLLAK